MENQKLNWILLSKGIVHYDAANYAKWPIDHTATESQFAALVKSFASLGYVFDPASLAFLKKQGVNVLTVFYKKTFSLLKLATGAAYNTKTVFYNQYPDVGDIPLAELYLNAMLHYISVAFKDLGLCEEAYYPETEDYKTVKLPFDEEHKPTVLKIVVSEKECVEKTLIPFFLDNFSSPIAISFETLANLKEIVGYLNNNGYSIPVPNKIPFKENMAQYVKIITDTFGGLKGYLKTFEGAGKSINGSHFPFMTSATDYLRLYCVVSGGSAMLDGKTKFKSQPRIVRRWFLSGLESILDFNPSAVSEFAERREIWIRAFEYLHPGEFKEYREVNDAAFNLRRDEITTYNGNLEKALATDIDQALKLLKDRPGVFARRLDALLREPKYAFLEHSRFLMEWEKVASGVSVPVLYQLRDHFIARDSAKNKKYKFGRSFAIKTDKGVKTHYEDEDKRLPLQPNDVLWAITAIDHAIGAQLGKNGGTKVYFSDAISSFSNYALPTNDRAVSANLQDVPFGSYIQLEPKEGFDVVRLFTHWHDIVKKEHLNLYGQGRVDIDLSAQMFREDFSYAGALSWHSLDSNGKGIVFSGDIIAAPQGANEYIDVDLKAFREKNPDVRYIAIVNNVYTCQPFGNIPECFSGAMLRSGVNSGELFEPSSVVAKFDLHQDSAQQSLALILDIVDMRLYKIDQPMLGCRSVAVNHISATGAVIRKAVSDKTMLSVALEAAINGGRLIPVYDQSDAEIIIGLDEKANVHPWDQEKISKIIMQPLDKVADKE